MKQNTANKIATAFVKNLANRLKPGFQFNILFEKGQL